MGLLARNAPPCASTHPLFGPFVPRVTRVRRTFARVGGISCAGNRAGAPVCEPQGLADRSLRRDRHLKSGLAPAYLVSAI